MSERKKPLILIVEDDQASFEVICTYLEHHGFEIRGAGNGHEGLRLTRELAPDLVLMDIGMPADGYDALRLIKLDERLRDIPVIAFTGFAMDHDRIRAVDVGFDLYIPKPAEPKVVLEEVRRLLGMDAA